MSLKSRMAGVVGRADGRSERDPCVGCEAYESREAVMAAVCRGEASASFLEGRSVNAMLLARPPVCVEPVG